MLGGGGVRGIAHIGAVAALEDADFTINHVAGASAGAIVAALVVAGVPSIRMQSLLQEMDARSFALSDLLGQARGTRAVGALLDRLGFDGPTPDDWLEDVLEEHGVRTFGDLRDDHAHGPDSPCHGYRLVVRSLDIANRRVVRLPWDYGLYGLDPNAQSVAQAVRASMSVPLVFNPVVLDGGVGPQRGVLVDGGMGGGVPVRVFDRVDGARPERPTFGVRLSPTDVVPADEDLSSPLAVVKALVETLVEAVDPLDDALPPDEARTLTIDTLGLRTLDVRNLGETGPKLVESGRVAMEEFLAGFDFDAWCAAYRGVAPTR